MKLTNQHKKYAVWGGAAVLLGGLAYVMTLSTEPTAALEPPTSVSLTGGYDTRAVSVEALARRIGDLEEESALSGQSITEALGRIETDMNRLGGRVETALAQDPDERQEASIRTMNGRIASLERVLREMQRQIDEGRGASRPIVQTTPENTQLAPQRTAPPPTAPVDPDPLYAAVPPLPLQQTQPDFPTTQAPTIALYAPEDAPEQSLAESIPPLLIPAGSIITTYSLTGLDAPTGIAAQENPMPILLRIKKEAIMPNEWYGDVVDCHLLGSAFGDLSSHRVMIRGELASCTLSDGSIVEHETKFFATGSDGKVGIQGQLISKAGSALARAALGGFAEGIATAAATPDIGTGVTFTGALTEGAAGGANTAFNKLSEYYIDLAEQTFPVIEVPNGRWIDVILTSTLEIHFDGAL